MALMTDATLGEIKDQIVKQNQALKNFALLYARTTWQEIAANVRAGRAKYLYEIGTELVCNYTVDDVTYEFPWVVVDNDREWELEDGTKVPGLTLQAKFGTVEEIQFDAPEQEEATETNALEGWYYCGRNANTYTMLNLATGDAVPYGDYEYVYHGSVNHADAYRYGYNRYSLCAQRQWLNSAAGKGEWWTSQHPGDCPPSQLNNRKGFMAGLDADFLAVLRPVKIKTACNTVTDGGKVDTVCDTFFLPSVEETYGVPQIADVEGPYFPYWKTVTGLDEPSNAANDGRSRPPVNNQSGAGVNLRCRSSNRTNVSSAWIVVGSGQLSSGTYASNSYRSQPACVIC